MANKKPIILKQEGQSDQSHDVAEGLDYIDAGYLAVDRREGNALSTVTVLGEGLALRVEGTRERNENLFPGRNLLPFIDTNMIAMHSSTDGYAGRERTPLPHPRKWQKTTVDNQDLWIPVYEEQKHEFLFSPDRIVSLQSIKAQMKRGPFYGGRSEVNVMPLDNDHYIDADLYFVDFSGNERRVLRGSYVPVGKLRDLAKLTRTFINYVVLKKGADAIVLYWAPSKYMFTSGINGYYGSSTTPASSWYRAPTYINVEQNIGTAGQSVVMPEEDEILCFEYPFRRDYSGETIAAVLLEVTP